MNPFRTLFVTVLVVVLVGMAATPGVAREHSLAPGAWSLQFRVADNFQLASFDGFSLKRHFSEKSALRLGANANFNKVENFAPSAEQDRDRTNYNVNLLFVRYVAPSNDVKLYWGAGPMGDRQTTTSETSYDLPDVRQHQEVTEWGAGVLGILGVEWFAVRYISLSAEYRTGATYRYERNRSSTFDSSGEVMTNETSVKRWDYYGGGSVVFGLSAYF